MMPTRTRILLPLVALAALTWQAGAARADLMSACAPEITRYCGDVSQGRGRVSACLAGEMGNLSAACRPEVQAVGRSRLTPADVRKVFDPAFRAALPHACVAPAARFCPGVPVGGGPIFACLYARSDRVGKDCSDAARATLR